MMRLIHELLKNGVELIGKNWSFKGSIAVAENAVVSGDLSVVGTIGGNVAGNVNGNVTGAHNGAVGNITPSTGSFTTLTTSGAVQHGGGLSFTKIGVVNVTVASGATTGTATVPTGAVCGPLNLTAQPTNKIKMAAGAVSGTTLTVTVDTDPGAGGAVFLATYYVP